MELNPIILKVIHTKKEAQKLFSRLHDEGYKWRSGLSLKGSESTEKFINALPCKLFIDRLDLVTYYERF